MTATRCNDRDGTVEEYLQLLRSLACELERGMRAIAENSVTEFEDSVSNQRVMSDRLVELAASLSAPGQSQSTSTILNAERDLKFQIQVASAALQVLNRRYAVLLDRSSRSVALMVSLFDSFRGNLQEAPGARPTMRTWSCQV